MQQTEFNLIRRGGYDPAQVNQHIERLQTELGSIRQELELARSQQQETSPRLYDPDGAVVKVLAAAQAAADKLVSEAESIAKEKIANYYQAHKDEIEAQDSRYEMEKSQLTSKLADVRAMQGELKREVKEFVEQTKFKMTVIAQVARELEGLALKTDMLEGSKVTSEVENATHKIPDFETLYENSASQIQAESKIENNIEREPEQVAPISQPFPAAPDKIEETIKEPVPTAEPTVEMDTSSMGETVIEEETKAPPPPAPLPSEPESEDSTEILDPLLMSNNS